LIAAGCSILRFVRPLRLARRRRIRGGVLIRPLGLFADGVSVVRRRRGSGIPGDVSIPARRAGEAALEQIGERRSVAARVAGRSDGVPVVAGRRVARVGRAGVAAGRIGVGRIGRGGVVRRGLRSAAVRERVGRGVGSLLLALTFDIIL
jgi:hypothetical protein